MAAGLALLGRKGYAESECSKPKLSDLKQQGAGRLIGKQKRMTRERASILGEAMPALSLFRALALGAGGTLIFGHV